jgi:hypothetical protein
MIGDDLIEWHVSFQSMVSHSSTESELMAIDLCVRRIQAARWLFQSMGGTVEGPTNIDIDCSSAITLANNPIQNHRQSYPLPIFLRARFG